MYKLPPSTLGSASSIHSNKTQQAATLSALVNADPDANPGGPRVRAQMMASGFYARCAVSPDRLASWLQAGVPLDPARAQTFRWGSVPEWDQQKGETDCQKKCDDSVVCWGFLYDIPSQSCLYKGGEDALRTRGFFVLPNMAAVGNITVGNTTLPLPEQGALP